MKRTLLLAVTTIMALSLIAPAGADVIGAGTFTGTAAVGRHFRNLDNTEDRDCNKETVKEVVARGQGLYAPEPVGPVAKNGVWSFHTTFQAVGRKNDGTTGPLTGSLDACGFLTHTLRDEPMKIGPACTVSKGHSGLGRANFDGGGGINLFDIMWKTSAGPYIPITAKYQAWDGDKPGTKKNKWGNAIAMVLVNPPNAASCLDTKNCAEQKTAGPGTPGCGAQEFFVVGEFELVQTDGSKGSVIRPNDAPGMCKNTAEPTCLFDTKKGNGKETPKPKPTG